MIDESQGPAPDQGDLLCAMLIESLPVDGASISIVGESGGHSVVAASDPLARSLEAQQFELGEGPHWQALRSEKPSFLDDLTGAAAREAWPLLAAAAAGSGARALFAIPLTLGAATVGVSDLYSRTAGARWSEATMRLALDVALAVSAPAVRLATRSADGDSRHTGRYAVELRREVHQAAGMVMVQLDCSASVALLRLRAYAFASGLPLDLLAREVIARRIDFARL